MVNNHNVLDAVQSLVWKNKHCVVVMCFGTPFTNKKFVNPLQS